jgi:hypothetical protein
MVLEEGEKKDWFNSNFITLTSIVSIIAILSLLREN